eukprot:TRINITY_DN3287_c0_g1_i1.p2 TRINITY_DN3287_c0_g1~~TRINITY_DN3287_c0_g1_i1.p2  ORF type:complete len:92 (-),score=23.29 TRINITY_DN3287_c0_g1_i1:105-380(-)
MGALSTRNGYTIEREVTGEASAAERGAAEEDHNGEDEDADKGTDEQLQLDVGPPHPPANFDCLLAEAFGLRLQLTAFGNPPTPGNGKKAVV